MAEDQPGRATKRFLDRFKNASGDGSFGEVSDFGMVPGALSVAEPQSLAGVHAQTVSEVTQQIASEGNGRRCDALRENEKYGHVALKIGKGGLLEKCLHLIEEAVAVGFHGHAALFRILHQQFFLLGRQFGGNLDLNRINLITGRASLQAGNS